MRHAVVALKYTLFYPFISPNVLLRVFNSHNCNRGRLKTSWNLPFAGGFYRHLTKMTHETSLRQNLEIYTYIYPFIFSCKCHFLSNFISVSGLKCYVCKGTEDTCSKDKLKGDNSKEVTCVTGMDRCMRIWTKKDDTTTVDSSCSTESSCKDAEKVADDDCKADKCAVGCCDTDLCNAGWPVSFSVFLMTVCCTLGLALLK